jgi:nucleoid-associated protein YgaU
MTREGKLALIAGFALIVLMGVLLSDHLSRAAHITPEPLVAVDRAHHTLSDQTRIEFGPGATTDQPNPNLPTQTPSEWSAVDLQEIRRAETKSQRLTAGHRYTVRSGDTLTRICQRELGSTELVGAVAKLNGLDRAATLSIGQELLLPSRDTLADAHRAAPTTTPLKRHTYRVQNGDTLSELAQRLMGSARLTTQLHAMNKGVISDPDNLQIGAVIIYTPPATN